MMDFCTGIMRPNDKWDIVRARIMTPNEKLNKLLWRHGTSTANGDKSKLHISIAFREPDFSASFPGRYPSNVGFKVLYKNEMLLPIIISVREA
jgi:hypothetical protein